MMLFMHLQPLFLYLPFQSVHSANPDQPLQAPYKYFEKMSHIKDKNRRMFAGSYAHFFYFNAENATIFNFKLKKELLTHNFSHGISFGRCNW